jgi:hypothetical protein
VLHVLEHLEEEGALLTRRLDVGTGILFAYGCRVECRPQQGVFTLERVKRLLHERGIWCGRVCRVLLERGAASWSAAGRVRRVSSCRAACSV